MYKHKAYFELEKAFSISMPQPVFKILINYKKHVLYKEFPAFDFLACYSTSNALACWGHF